MGDCAPGEYLIFRLGDLHYGVGILQVREIRGHDAVNPLPDAPEYLRGAIDLRGELVPVIDLRRKLRVAEAVLDGSTVMIVLDLGGRRIAAVADSVEEVVALAAGDLRPPPPSDIGIDTSHLVGIGLVGERLVFLLDTAGLLRRDELAVLDGHMAAAMT
jgi:purine-binding chemotaxis protein CheW